LKNIQLRTPTRADIDERIARILRGLGNPEPPLDLRFVRDLLRLDRNYYSTNDDGVLRETVSRLKIAGKQVLMRPTLLAEAVRKLSLKALYLPDQRRILLDKSLPQLKHRWNEAHEIGHSVIPWHQAMMLGDDEQTLMPLCHAIMEAEANYAAGQILFLRNRFVEQANDVRPNLDEIIKLTKTFGNTMTSTLWRFVELAHPQIPLVGLVSGHPHPRKRKPDFDAENPCRYCVQSPQFAARFGSTSEGALFAKVVPYCGSQRGGPLGDDEVVLNDDNGDAHLFYFETFFNGHEALTLGVWQRSLNVVVSVNQ
jgi:hypothetical protein